jgi:SAM-dependent methyltransferase
MPAPSSEPLDGFYRFLWTAPENDPERFAFLDQELGGRGSADFLREHATEQGLGPTSVVLDAGCGKGRHACMLANEFGCRVIALDLLAHNLHLARARFASEAVGGAIGPVRGSLQRLPVGDGRVDLVWCGDMFNHLGSAEEALSECARVLKPGGTVLIYCALASDPLVYAEAASVCAPMGVNPATLAPATYTAAAARAGLRVRLSASTFPATSPFFEAISAGMVRDVTRLAHMLRTRERVIDRLGAGAYRWLEALYRWNLHVLIGTLTYHVWILEKAAAG